MSASASSTLDAICAAVPGELQSEPESEPLLQTEAPSALAVPGSAVDADIDRQLMERYCAGDRAAFEILYNRYRGPLRRFVARLCRDQDEGDEVFQEVWMAVIHARRSYRHTAKFKTWLFSIAHRRLQDRWRRRGRQATGLQEESDLPAIEQIADESVPSEDWMHNVELQRALAAAIGRLPPAQRAVFLMKAEGNLSLEEIATAMGTGFETAKSRMRYAVARLRVELEDWK
jgi:RNA polymerase sigma-70 factor, ECF subfamily